MDVKEMTTVDNITNTIAERLGNLTHYAILTFEDSMKILKFINDKQYVWMENNFSAVEIYDFLNKR